MAGLPPNDGTGASPPAADASPVDGAAPPPAQRRSRWRLLWIAAQIYCLYAIVLYALQRHILFPRHVRQPPPNADVAVAGLEKLFLDTSAGRVEAWLLPGARATPEQPGPAVIFAHGNAEFIDDWVRDLSSYRLLGVTVLLPEYRGYGRSAGTPSQQALTEDFIRFYDLLAARPDVDPARIVFHGRSIGGGVLCALAEQRKPAALVLQSTFTSVRDLSRRYLVPAFLVSDPFDNRAVLTRLTCPILIAHGKRDRLIPFDHAQALHAASTCSTLLALDADHNDCPPDWPEFMRQVERFLRDAGVLPARA